ncbi:hypothetical protein [Streptomyces sp. NPDC059071]
MQDGVHAPPTATYAKADEAWTRWWTSVVDEAGEAGDLAEEAE